MAYIGRFAPSPSGALHFGSLVAAVGSYLQAKSQNGLWQVRIEDIDPPREIKGASQDILDTLLAYGVNWDGEVIYQSQQTERYDLVLAQLYDQKLSYYCQCTRKIIKQQGGLVADHCQQKQLPASKNALRINLAQLTPPINHFIDTLHGKVTCSEVDDFIIKRKDGLYAYNLAVVIDDISQNITEVVRGADLIETTVQQLALYQLLNKTPPSFLHLPVAVTAPGQKLSKQNHALAVSKSNPIRTLIAVLSFLGLSVPDNLHKESCQAILEWAIIHWDLALIPKKTEIQI